MDRVQELFAKKHQEIEINFQKICEKISIDFSTRRMLIEKEKESNVGLIPPRLHETNPDAFNNLLNSIYRNYGNKLQKLQEDYILEMKRVSIIHNHNKKQLNDAFARAQQEYENVKKQLNDNSNKKFKNLSETFLDSTNPVTPRISTVSSAR